MASAQAASSCSGRIQKNDELIELSGFSGSILLLEAVFVGRDSATSPGRYDPAEPSLLCCQYNIFLNDLDEDREYMYDMRR